MSEKVSLVAYLYAKPDKEAELVDILLSQVGPTRQEAGCIDYHLHRSNEDPLCYMFYENWTAMKDLEDHLAKPHLEPLLSRTDELLQRDVKIEFYAMLSDAPG
ncbi:MAG: putative quinol monooxygenase [Alphaproteobacteria bacterium]|nr:putative quinol monooxygenase [Alphaproteobacteria bacterium]MDP6590144.1 putative quinol monooxygenase [Alphaproteobacteria bacterium]MDP6817482.1 putative quinol monooxygenase [Alphaproteobacteria bacterium]|tara:strand:+ start:741 stop:1049 length:309 start_codon:yes stop_codon:yes gene_type:complete